MLPSFIAIESMVWEILRKLPRPRHGDDAGKRGRPPTPALNKKAANFHLMLQFHVFTQLTFVIGPI
jgi:hypothetical protein